MWDVKMMLESPLDNGAELFKSPTRCQCTKWEDFVKVESRVSVETCEGVGGGLDGDDSECCLDVHHSHQGSFTQGLEKSYGIIQEFL